MTPEAIRELQSPLDKKHVAKRMQSGRQLDYIEGWHAIAEANRIFGHDAWASETVDIRCVAEKPRKIGQSGKDGWGVSYVARVRIVVSSPDNPMEQVIREGVGAGHGIDADLGLAHESAIKEAETDARKRALMTFGWPFGLALYDKSRENVASEPAAGSIPASRGAGGGNPSTAPAPANRTSGGETLTGRETGAVKQGPAPVSPEQSAFITMAKKALALAESATDVAEWEERNKPEAARLGFRRDNEAGVSLRKAINERIAEIELADMPAGQLEAAE